MMNMFKRYQSAAIYFFTSFLFVFIVGEAVAQTITTPPLLLNSIVAKNDTAALPLTSNEFTITKALSNRLGQVDSTENNSLENNNSILVDSVAEPPIPSSALTTQSPLTPIALQDTVEPVFSERTANRLNLSGQSPNDPSRKRLALGDFNNDGNEDIIVARWTANAQLFINVAGVLTLMDEAFSNFADTSNARHTGVLDANGDGWQDLVLRNKLLLNLGEDSTGNWLGFSAGQTIAGAELDPFTIQTADFDGDGDIDVATSPGRRMLVNDGNGVLVSTPARMQASILFNVIKFAARDFDGDGDIDLAGPEISEQRHFVYYNDGNGNFTDALRLSLPLDTLTYTQVGADFNGDNIADFRIYADNQFPRAFMSNGNFNGNFPQYTRRQDGNLFGDNGKHGLVHIRDIDDDGDLDFVLSSLELFIDRVDSLNEKTEIIINKDINSGTFEVFADPEYRDEESFDVKITDINLDGNMDLFIAHQGRLGVYINAAPPKIIEIIDQSNTPSATNETSDFNIVVNGASGNVVTTWDMGDGTTINSGSEFSVAHSYTTPGRYLVTVSVDNGANIDSLVFWHTVFEPVANFRPNTSSSIVYEDRSNGSGNSNTDRVWSINPDHNSVSAINVGSNALVAEINVGNNPSSLAFGGDGRLYVVNKDDATLSVINTATLNIEQVISTLAPAAKPHGIVFNPVSNSTQAFVTLEATGQLAKFDFATNSLAIEDIGPFPRELSTNSDGSLVYVSRFITGHVPGEDTRFVSTAGGGEVWVVDAASLLTTEVITLPFNNQPDSATSSRGVPNYLMAPITSPSGLNAFVPANVSNIYRGQFRDGQNREHNKLVRSMLAKLNLQTNQEETANRHDFDNSAQPTAGAFDPTGNYLYLVFEASRRLRVYDVHAGEVLDNLDVGFAPRGVTVSPDGSRVIVDNYLSRSLHVFDASAFVAGDSVEHTLLSEVNKTSTEPLTPTLLLGKQLFFDAADERLSAQSYISCATCHADGGHDGRTWDFSDVGEGLRNTIDLRGRSGTGHGLVHWTANFNEIQDFENDIRDIFQGSGLMSDADFANTAATLGAAKFGLSDDLDALATFVTSLSAFGPSPYRLDSGEKTAAAIAGEQVFADIGCASCHNGSQFTNSPEGGNFNDIGTVDADTGGRLGGPLMNGGLDTPTLKGLWHGAPYLHDGAAATVKDAILAHTSPAVGFDVGLLTNNELDDLEAYLLQLGDDDIANTEPVLSNPGTQNSNVGAVISLQIQATDLDSSNTLSFVASGLPSGLTMNGDGLISGTANLAGSFNVTIGVIDGAGGSDNLNFAWTINTVSNVLPTADAGANQDLIDIDGNGTETVTLDASASSDSDGNLISYVWSSNSGIAITDGATSTVDLPIGTHIITLTVIDDAGDSANDNIAITVSSVPNNTPTANAGADQTVVDTDDNGVELVSLSALNSSDNDGSIVSYTWSSDSGVSIPSGVTANVNFAIGTHNVTLTITDDDGANASDTVTIIVSPAPNTPPTIVNPGTQTTLLGNAVSVFISANDADVGDVLSFSQSGLPDGLTIDSVTGEISGLPTQAGIYNPNITVTDNNGSNDSISFQWTIQGSTVCTVYNSTDIPVNLPNQVASISSDLVITNASNANIVDMTVSVDMTHNWIGDLIFTLNHQTDSTNTSVVLLDQPGVPATQFGCREDDVFVTFNDNATGNTETTCITTPPALNGGFNPTAALSAFNQESANGTWVLTIDDNYVAADAGVLNNWSLEICTDSGVIENQLPSADAGSDQTLTDNDDNGSENVTLDASNSVDSDGSIVTATWLSDSGLVIADGLNSNADFPVGVHTVTLTVTDDAGDSATDTVLITVNAAPNIVPVANAGNDQTLIDSDDTGAETVTLDGSASNDSNGNIVNYAWSSDTGITITNGVSSNAAFPVGVHFVTLTVTDDAGDSASDTILITINPAPNVAPTADAGADITAVDLNNDGTELITLNGANSNDSDGNIISYIWNSNTGINIANGANTSANFPIGTHTVTLTVTDDDGATSSDTLQIVVNPAPNVPPIAVAGADQTVLDLDNNGTETIFLNGSASSDNDGNISDYVWSNNTGMTIANGANTTVNLPLGVHTVTLTVTDDDGASTTDNLLITIEAAPNNPPQITDPGTQLSLLGSQVNVLIAANDPDIGNILSFAQTGLPEGLNINANNGEISGVPSTAGVYNPVITVTDNSGASSNLSFEWTIQAGLVCNVYNSANIPVNLPNQVASISSDLLVSNNGVINDVNVSVDMAHAWVGDLKLTLTQQSSNTSVVLLDQPGVPATQFGCRENDLLMTLDDEATANAENTCVIGSPTINGDFAPTAPLSAFNQQTANGTWTLTIEDDYVAADAGVLNNWSIEICTTASGQNQAPIAVAGADQSVTDTDNTGVETINLDASASADADGNIASYVWSSDSGVTIADSATSSANFAIGEHLVTLTVTDTAGASATDTLLVTVLPAPNTAPSIVDPGTQLSLLNEAVNLAIVANDPDTNDVLTFSQSGLPDGLNINSQTGDISGTPNNTGVYTATITVTDNSGASSELSFTWTVQGGLVCTVYNSTNIPIALPNQTASISSNLVVNNVLGNIVDVNVTLGMEHNWVGDLTLRLSHQASNTSVTLLDQPGVPASQFGCSRDDLAITLDDDATGNAETTCGTTPPTLNGNFAPSTPLNAFNQQTANGTWVLTVEDDYVAADAGVLNNWSLEICTQ